MHICHITTVHRADDARIFHRMACGLARRGLSVVVIGPSETGTNGSVRMSPWNASVAQAGRSRRAALALRAALAERADVYHFHDPELIPLGLILKILRPSSAVVYDVHEDYPAMMLEKYWLPGWSRRLVGRAMRLAHVVAGRCLDGIVTADPGVQSDFAKVAAGRTIVYHNFPSLPLFEAQSPRSSVAKADLIYVGGMSERAGTFILLDALALLAEQGMTPSVRLAGYTDGDAGRRAVEAAIQDRGLASAVRLLGRLSHSAVPAFLRGGRIGLVTLQPIAKFMKNIPSKMFEYWACGLPVIASDLPPIRPFLSDAKNGLLFTATSAKDLARAIQFLLERPEKIEAMGRCGRRLVHEQWNNDRQIDGLIRFYERLREK